MLARSLAPGDRVRDAKKRYIRRRVDREVLVLVGSTVGTVLVGTVGRYRDRGGGWWIRYG